MVSLVVNNFMISREWHDFQIGLTDDRFIPWFCMAHYVPHTEILDDQCEQILGSEIHWWLTGRHGLGEWHLVEFNTRIAPRTARHQMILLLSNKDAYDAFIHEFGAVLTFNKATLYEKKYREIKTDLDQRIEQGEYDLSKLGWRYRKSAAKEYLRLEKKMKKYRSKWSALKARAKEMAGHSDN